ncbi:MAG: hypothetical protein DMF99_21170 [Acidobacteria bacterium]|nr:MAG: hypothetical protein DMF99_21170 [Acidobacteriota bacterium]
MKTESVREHFRIQVPDYQGLMRRLIPFYDNQRDVMLALIPFDRGVSLRVLDLGCGPGLMAARILAEFPHAQLTLFDLTAEMIEACQSRLEGTDRIVYQVGDFRTADFGTGYDLIIASLSLHHLMPSEGPAFAKRAFQSRAVAALHDSAGRRRECLVSEASGQGSSRRDFHVGWYANEPRAAATRSHRPTGATAPSGG